MNEYAIGQKVRFAGLVVTIQSLRRSDGRYVVEDSTGAFFPAYHDKLSPLGVELESDRAAPFQDIASRAAMSAKGKPK